MTDLPAPSPEPCTPSSTSLSLLEQVKGGDSQAWRQLVDLYAPMVYGWCRHRQVQAEDAADVTQEVFLAVSSHIESYRRDRPGDTFRGWLWTITRSKIADHFRRQSGQAQAKGGSQAQEALAQVPSPLPDDADREMPDTKGDGFYRRALELARTGFGDQTWMAFWRVVVDGCCVADVAEELQMSRWAVYKAKSRVSYRLKEILSARVD